jgi:hypothetical protein
MARQLTGRDMTSDVKGVRYASSSGVLSSRCPSAVAEVTRRLILRYPWVVPPSRPSCPPARSRPRSRHGEGTPHRGGASSHERWQPSGDRIDRVRLKGPGFTEPSQPRPAPAIHRPWPPRRVGMVASGAQSARALTKPHRCLPADGLDDVGLGFQSSLEVSADVRGVAIGPGAFDQDATRMGVASFGDRTLPTPLSTRVFRGCQARYASAPGDAGEAPATRGRPLAPHPAFAKRRDARAALPLHVRLSIVRDVQACGGSLTADVFLKDGAAGWAPLPSAEAARRPGQDSGSRAAPEGLSRMWRP